MKPRVSIGIPSYGGVSNLWWTQMLQFMAALSKEIEIGDIITCSTMTADHSRNLITDEFLKKSTEWLFWIDSDTQVPAGAVERMLAHGKTLVSGLYYGKNKPHPPIAYLEHQHAYQPINKAILWEKGEIIRVDSAGMGCMLTHRSVFEDIRDNFEVLQVEGGGLVTVPKKNILGDIETTNGLLSHEHDGKVYKGQLRLRVMKPTLASLKFPYFMIDHLRTEDIHFFELAKQVGHNVFLDTSIECGHVRDVPYTGADYRDENGH